MASNLPLNDPIFIPELEENLVDDPYGTAMFVILNTLNRAADHKGSMNDHEWSVLESLAVLLAPKPRPAG